MESPFDVLGIDEDADEEAVKRAYQERVKDAHPDHGGSREEFLRVRSAYEAIKTGETDRSGGKRPDRPSPWENTTNGQGVPEPGGADEDEPEDEREEPSRVTYLDYDVLADHGWTLDDEDLFEKAAGADLDPGDYGRFLVQPDETLLEAAENRGFAWPFACRGGACANCAVAVVDGEMDLPINHVLPREMTDSGIRLSCVGTPTTDEMQVIYNVKHLPDLDELRLPPHPFERIHGD